MYQMRMRKGAKIKVNNLLPPILVIMATSTPSTTSVYTVTRPSGNETMPSNQYYVADLSAGPRTPRRTWPDGRCSLQFAYALTHRRSHAPPQVGVVCVHVSASCVVSAVLSIFPKDAATAIEPSWPTSRPMPSGGFDGVCGPTKAWFKATSVIRPTMACRTRPLERGPCVAARVLKRKSSGHRGIAVPIYSCRQAGRPSSWRRFSSTETAACFWNRVRLPSPIRRQKSRRWRFVVPSSDQHSTASICDPVYESLVGRPVSLQRGGLERRPVHRQISPIGQSLYPFLTIVFVCVSMSQYIYIYIYIYSVDIVL